MANTGIIALKGMLHNIADLPHVNYEMPWWDINCYNNTIIDGKVYGMVSDISMMTLSGARGIIFNRDLAKKYQLEDLYTLVKEDRWTLDKMTEMISAVSTDLNGDQQFTDADVYGMLVETGGQNSNVVHLAIGSGINFVSLNNAGEMKVAYNDEKTISLIEKLRAVLLDPTHCLTYDYLQTAPGLTGSYWNYGRTLFAGDHFLFMQGGAMLFEEIGAAGMDSEYGIMPNPKYNADQKNYYHMVDRETSVVTIPSSNAPEDMERLGILLEDLAYQSSKDVKTAYYDTVIKLRRAEVPEMGEMMDIIKGSIGYQYETIYGVMALNSILASAFTTGNYASTIQANIEKYETSLANTFATIKSLP